jgi:hypothetical protein
MRGFDDLRASAGVWHGTNRVQISTADPVEESASRVIVAPVLRDTFVRLDQTWDWKGDPQAGSLLIGYDPKSGNASGHWIDTWHNGRRVMPMSGAFDGEGKLVLHGHFPVAGSADWGWRMEIWVNADRMRIAMACLHPSGEADGGVWTELVRATS